MTKKNTLTRALLVLSVTTLLTGFGLYARSASGLLPAISFGAAASADTSDSTATAAVKYRVVIHVSDAESTGKWKLALNNINNLRTQFGPENVEVELVVYGPAIKMLAKTNTALAADLKALADKGVVLVACQNSMANNGLTSADMFPFITEVPSGAAEIVIKQTEGWAYLRP